MGSAFRTRRLRLGALLVFAGTLLVSGLPASASAATDDVFWFDGPTPAVTCAYPESNPATLDRIRVRGPRVEFPSSVGEVGWVRWTTLIQERRAGSSAWTTIASRTGRMVVDVYNPRTFKTRVIDVPGGPGSARIRVVGRIRWIDQGGSPAGVKRHVMSEYGLRHVEPGTPIGGGAPEDTRTGSCRRSWFVQEATAEA